MKINAYSIMKSRVMSLVKVMSVLNKPPKKSLNLYDRHHHSDGVAVRTCIIYSRKISRAYIPTYNAVY